MENELNKDTSQQRKVSLATQKDGFIISKDQVSSIELEWRDEMYLSLKYLPPQELQNLVDRFTELKWDDSLKMRDKVLNIEKLKRFFAEKIVTGWRGFTLRKLSKVGPINLKAYPTGVWDSEIEFTSSEFAVLAKHMPDLMRFVQDNSTEVSHFRDEESILKN